MSRRHFVLSVRALATALSLPMARAQAETWDDYARMFSRSAEPFWSGSTRARQWSPQSPSGSDTAWGDPATWPPSYGKKFQISADSSWVLVDGYSDGTGLPTRHVQRVTNESIGDADCQNVQPIPDDGGRQHYATWNIPAEGYCLLAEGTIRCPNPDGSTFTVRVAHHQHWTSPERCDNAYFHGQTCISQHEEWWDDNGSAFAKRIDRAQQLARGLGPAFAIRQTFPSLWSSDGRFN